MKLLPILRRHPCLVRGTAVMVSLVSLAQIHAAPFIISTVPTSGASEVPLTATLTINFSEPMDTTLTTAYLVASNPYENLPSSLSWNPAATVLTCTPDSPLPAGRTILWGASGQNPAGVPLTGYTGGTFTTAAGPQLILTNAAWSGGKFSFDVTSPSGQTLTVEYSSTMAPNQWQFLLTTNSPAGRVHIIDPHSSTNRFLFYRARTGS